MTCRTRLTLDKILLLQIVHEPIVEGMRGFDCASKFGKPVTRHFAQVFVIERDAWGGTRVPLGYESAVSSVQHGICI